jgi:hypothetical protein
MGEFCEIDEAVSVMICTREKLFEVRAVLRVRCGLQGVKNI